MSHLSKVKTQFKDLGILKQTLRDMGCNIKENSTVVMNMLIDGGNSRQPADLVLTPADARGKDFMGVRQSGDTYEFFGDGYDCGNERVGSYGGSYDVTRFAGQVVQQYSENLITEHFSSNPELADFSLASKETDPVTGEVILTFEDWA